MIYPGFYVSLIADFAKRSASVFAVDNHQSNGLYGVHQARLTALGDPTTYRLIIAPADAPITINGRPIGEHFAQPLGDR